MTDQPPFPMKDFLNDLLVSAAGDGAGRMVGTLLQYGADPNHRGGAALIEAAREGHAEIAYSLLCAGARVDAHNQSALCAAAYNGHVRTVKLLLEAGADLSVHQHGPYREAVQRGDRSVAALLRQAGSYDPLQKRTNEESRQEIVESGLRRQEFEAAAAPMRKRFIPVPARAP